MKWLGGPGAATEPFCHLDYLWADHGALGEYYLGWTALLIIAPQRDTERESRKRNFGKRNPVSG